MTDIVYGVRITGEASSAKKAFEETSEARKKLDGSETTGARNAVKSAREQEISLASLNRQRLAFVAIGASMLVTLRSFISAGLEAERAQNRLSSVIHATGGALGVSRRDYDDLAQSLAHATQFDDEAIRNGQATLLQFGNIHGQVFKDAIRLSADLAAFMGTDVTGAAQMLGKSLQSPTEGLMFIERQFGKLTEAEEKHIRALVEQGRGWEAQQAVIALWEKKIGGAAETMNTGLTKATKDVTKAWDDMLKAWVQSEAVGGRINRMLGGTRDVLEDIANLAKGPDPIKAQLQRVSELNDQIEKFEKTGSLGVGAGVVGGRGFLEDQRKMPTMLADLKSQRAAAMAELRRLGELDQASAFEAGLNPGPAPDIKLGGDVREAYIKAENERKDAQLAQSYQRRQDVLDKYKLQSLDFLDTDEEKRAAIKKEADAVRDAINPWNAYAREVERLRGLMNLGIISENEFTAAVALQARTVGGAMEDMADKGTQGFAELKDAIEGWGRDLSRELARGEVSLLSFMRLFEELLAMQIQKRAVQPFLKAGTSFIDELLAGSVPAAYTGNAAPFHAGGIVGLEGGARRYVHPAYFERAPRLHGGGLLGGEVPAILKRGEGVFTPEQMRAMGGAGNLKINVINESGVPVQGQASAPRPDASGLVVDLVLRRLAVDGAARQQLRTQLSKPDH